MDFKSVVAKDMQVFFNTKELGELHQVDGMRDVECILEDDDVDKDTIYDGVDLIRRKLHIEDGILEKTPVMGGILDVDGIVYRVLDVYDQAGVLEVRLEANVS